MNAAEETCYQQAANLFGESLLGWHAVKKLRAQLKTALVVAENDNKSGPAMEKVLRDMLSGSAASRQDEALKDYRAFCKKAHPKAKGKDAEIKRAAKLDRIRQHFTKMARACFDNTPLYKGCWNIIIFCKSATSSSEDESESISVDDMTGPEAQEIFGQVFRKVIK
ncbi:unnamed protein product, partial [Amoebophrya sp. A120]|eukprot:GSA120T00010809001.1